MLIDSYVYDDISDIKDASGKIINSKLVNLLQLCARKHADSLGVGSKFCSEHNYGWIVARQVINFEKEFDENKVIVTTFPQKPTRLGYVRQYEVRNIHNELLCTAHCLWVLLDFNTMTMITDPNLFKGDFITDETTRIKRIKPGEIKTDSFIGTYQVESSDIDEYHHMNNAKYFKIVDKFISDEKESIQIDYHNQALENEIINIYKTIDQTGSIILTGLKEDQLIFNSLIKLKERTSN